MRLSDYIVEARTVVPLVAAGLPEAARALCDRLVASGVVQNPEALAERVESERPEDIVAMGDRAFLLHYRTDAVREIAVAIGTAQSQICRELGDGDEQCAHIVLMVAAPPRMASRYLQLVGALARLLSRPETVDAVLARDFPVIQGVILFFALLYVLVNLLVDVSYLFLDPRIRY